MATNPNLLDVFQKNQYNLEEAAFKSKAWFNQQILLLSKQRITPNNIMRNSDENRLKARIIPGNLYMYFYDPKTKADLPYYDRFPMVLPYRSVPGGFLGLNLHYLPYQMRTVLMHRLMTFKTNDKMDGNTRIKYSWSLIDGVSKYAAAAPCIKHYLLPHVKSPFRKVESKDWGTAMLLPVERFVGATKEQVWKDSVKKI
jgi:hypothetical protein